MNTEHIAGPGHNQPKDDLDFEIERELKDFVDQLEGRAGEVSRCRVSNDDEAGRATALAGILADIAAGAEKKRVDLKEPHLRAGKRIDAAFSAFTEIAKKAKAGVVAMIDSYRREQERRAQAERERLENEARAKADAAAKAAAAGNLIQAAQLEKASETAAAKSQDAVAPSMFRSSYGQSASARTEWHFEIIDRKRLPASVTQHPKVIETYKAVIAQLVRGGTREIPGVKIFSESRTVIRR